MSVDESVFHVKLKYFVACINCLLQAVAIWMLESFFCVVEADCSV